MKHAGPQTLAALAPLLAGIRSQPGLVERTPGAFYRRSKAYLHFHEDAGGIFADVKLDGTAFTRLRVTTAEEQRKLLSLVAQANGSPAPGRLKGSA
jgi:hypothetical protein